MRRRPLRKTRSVRRPGPDEGGACPPVLPRGAAHKRYPGVRGRLLFHCNLSCVFCQNHEISAGGFGREITGPQLAEILFRLKDGGSTRSTSSPQPPTPNSYPMSCGISGKARAPHYLEFQRIRKDRDAGHVGRAGGHLSARPEVYEQASGPALLGAPDYPSVAVAAIAEMKRQAGTSSWMTPGLRNVGS